MTKEATIRTVHITLFEPEAGEYGLEEQWEEFSMVHTKWVPLCGKKLPAADFDENAVVATMDNVIAHPLDMTAEKLCKKCEAHPDFALALLAAV